MILRCADLPAEVDSLARLYGASVRILGAAAYSPRQVAQWAAWPEDRAAFAEFLENGRVLVADVDGRVAAFGQLHPTDHLALLYTHPDFARRGLGAMLCRELEQLSREAGAVAITTDASALSRPLFEKRGFQVVHEELVQRGNVTFRRWRMCKRLV